MGEIRRTGGQAKLISGWFEFSIKRKCYPTDEQPFHWSFAGYESAARALKTLNPTDDFILLLLGVSMQFC